MSRNYIFVILFPANWSENPATPCYNLAVFCGHRIRENLGLSIVFAWKISSVKPLGKLMVFRHHFLTGDHSILVVISLFVLWRLEVCVSFPLPPFPLSPQQRIPLNYSPLVSLATALFSFPMRYRHSGQSVTGHRRTSALFPQQQSRHLSRIALPLVILSSMLVPPSIRSQQLRRHPPLFLCPV